MSSISVVFFLAGHCFRPEMIYPPMQAAEPVESDSSLRMVRACAVPPCLPTRLAPLFTVTVLWPSTPLSVLGPPPVNAERRACSLHSRLARATQGKHYASYRAPRPASHRLAITPRSCGCDPNLEGLPAKINEHRNRSMSTPMRHNLTQLVRRPCQTSLESHLSSPFCDFIEYLSPTVPTKRAVAPS